MFRRETGATYGEYIRDLRLDRAAVTLTTGRIKAAWVAAGYNYASNFTKDFRNAFGVTPTEYRRRFSLTLAAVGEEAVTTRRFVHNALILLVDDDEASRTTVQMYLQLEGFAVTTVGSAEDCITFVQGRTPDLIVLDYRLPGLDGIECLRRLRQGAPHSIRVIVYTADLSIAARQQEIDDLRAVLVSKLTDLDEVVGLIRQVLD
jgi:CheY-like chemotaxis protein